MKTTLLFVLTLSGLSALSSNIVREYHYIKRLKIWTSAQSYCRQKFNDLATVDNIEDNNRLMSVSKGKGTFAWIGLYDNFKGWKWSLGNADFNNEFSNWASNEPNSRHPSGSCAAVTKSGTWIDRHCFKQRSAVCYYEQGPSKYIGVQAEMTWLEAQTYCRSNYTDLASVRNMSENNHVSSLVTEDSWIGLHRQTWAYWSDQTPRTFTAWSQGQPQSSGATMRSCNVVKTATGTWLNVACNTRKHFICQTVYYPRHKTTLKLKFQSVADLKGPEAQQQILEQLHAKLEKHGLSDFKLRWIQTDGQTFLKEQKRKKEEGSGG